MNYSALSCRSKIGEVMACVKTLTLLPLRGYTVFCSEIHGVLGKLKLVPMGYHNNMNIFPGADPFG